MPRRYRLRLGDGTILMVDQQGLNTWKVDAKAMVQAAGGNWRPLKDLLAMQQAAAKYAEQNAPAPPPPSTVLPLVPPPPKKDKSEPRKPSTVLPLVPPPPKSQKLRPPTARPAVVPVAAPVVEEPSPVFEPSSMVLDAAPIPALPDLPAESIPDLAPPEPAAEEGPPISPTDFREQEELAPLTDAFARGDEAPVLAAPEAPAPQAWADEPVPDTPAPALFDPPSELAAPPAEDVVVATQDEIAVFAPPEPARAEPERTWDPEPSQWSDAVEPPSIGASRAVQTLADDPAPGYGHSDDHFAHGGSESYTARPSATRQDAYSYSSEPGFEEDEPDDLYSGKPRPIVLDERFVRVLNAVGVVLSKALGVLERMSGDLWDRLGKAWAARAAKRAEAVAREVPREELRTSFVPEMERAPEPPTARAFAEEPSVPRYDDAPARPAPVEDLPIIPLKPRDAEGSAMARVQKSVRSLGAGISAWALTLRGRVEDLVRRNRPASASPAPWSEPVSSSSNAAYTPPPRETYQPPPPTNEIPVIRMAKIDDEPVEQEDMYEGPSEGSYFPAARLWGKRLALTALFVVGAFLVYSNWEAWSPKAKTVGNTAFTEVTKFAETRERKARDQQALQAATEQLPHLAPDTLRLLMARTTSGVAPDPPEIFQAAGNATARGLSALTAEEREELSALGKTLLEVLSPAERVLLREYDEVRARRTPFAFEDKSALDLFARGARGLPAESRERMQTLLGKAIAAGLGAP